jgi:transposase
MSKARLVITAIEVEGRTPAEVSAAYGVSRSWLYELLARYRAEGDAAFQPRSRRPRTSPRATPADTVELVLRLRKQLADAGLDAGADTIGWHLTHRHQVRLSRATIHRILTRAGAVTPAPATRPKASYLRFAAEQPNETWQWGLHPPPAVHRHRRRDHHLARRPFPAGAARLRAPPDHRPDRAGHLSASLRTARPPGVLPQRATPATAYAARPKAGPGADRDADTHDRLRTDRIDKTGCVTLRLAGRLHHIGIGRTHAGTHVLLLVQDLHIRVIDAATGELLRELVLDPSRDYQPTGRRPGPDRK